MNEGEMHCEFRQICVLVRDAERRCSEIRKCFPSLPNNVILVETGLLQARTAIERMLDRKSGDISLNGDTGCDVNRGTI